MIKGKQVVARGLIYLDNENMAGFDGIYSEVIYKVESVQEAITGMNSQMSFQSEVKLDFLPGGGRSVKRSLS